MASKPKSSLKLPGAPGHAFAAFSADGEHLAVVDGAGELSVYTPWSKEARWSLVDEPVRLAYFTATELVAVLRTGELHRLRPLDGRRVGKGHLDEPEGEDEREYYFDRLAQSPDQRWLGLSEWGDQDFVVFDLRKKAAPRFFDERGCFAPDSASLLTFRNHELMQVDLPSGAERSLGVMSGAAEVLGFDAAGTTLFVAVQRFGAPPAAGVRRLAWPTLTPLGEISVGRTWAGLAVSPSGARAVVPAGSSLTVLDTTTGETVWIKARAYGTGRFTFSPDDQTLVVTTGKGVQLHRLGG